MHCREMMRKHAESVAPDETIAAAAARMREQRVGFLPVCGLDGRVVGVITDRDIVMRVCAEQLSVGQTLVRDVMTEHVVACHPEDSLDVAIELMARHQKLRLVVVDSAGRLSGIISWSDLAQTEEPIRVARLLRDIAAREYRVRSSRP